MQSTPGCSLCRRRSRRTPPAPASRISPSCVAGEPGTGLARGLVPANSADPERGDCVEVLVLAKPLMGNHLLVARLLHHPMERAGRGVRWTGRHPSGALLLQ